MKSFVAKILLIAFGVGLFPTLVDAGGFTGWRDLSWVYQRQCSTEDVGFEAYLIPAHDNPDGCANAHVVNLSCLVYPYDNAVATFLTAFASGAEVQLFVQGCGADGQAKVRAIKIRHKVPAE